MPLPQTPLEPENSADSTTPESSSATPSAANSEPASAPNPKAPLSFVPHSAPGSEAQKSFRVRTGRYGDLEEHELIQLLDTIEDERARARFRESVYLSVFIWLIVVWVLFYGPKYLWHAPKVVNPIDVFKQRELTVINAPVLPHLAVHPAPKIDTKTLEHLRATTPAPPAPQPATPPPAAATNVAPTPAAPPPPATTNPTPRSTANLPSAPLPSAPTPNFNPNAGSANAYAPHPGGGNVPGPSRAHNGATMGSGFEILSDTQGVDFNEWIRHMLIDVKHNWDPLLPVETEPPISKDGYAVVRVKVGPDGTIQDMHLDGSSHDEAINKSCWGAITSEGQFPPLPKAFHGPNFEFRLTFLVNQPQH